MQRKLLWMVKSDKIQYKGSKMRALAESEDLFDDSKLDRKSKAYKEAVKNLEKAQQLGFKVVTFIDKEYPDSLRNSPTPPAVLYVSGNVNALRHGAFAGIVGSRICDEYGLRISGSLAFDISQTGVGIVSGGAKGIDAAAHMGALRGKAVTVAVLGSGLDRPYPEVNIPLFERIVKNGGAVISEFPFGEPPNKRNFPRRNKIIAAMSDAVIVARAAARSGALITANHADSYGKAVFAVPGNVDSPLSAGTNALIRDGVTPCMSAMDVLDEIILRKPDFFTTKDKPQLAEEEPPQNIIKEDKPIRKVARSPIETEVFEAITAGKQTFEQIEDSVSFDGARLTAVLGMLELKGIISRDFDKKYKLKAGGEC